MSKSARKIDDDDKLASAKAQGQAQFDSIKEMVQNLERIRIGADKHGDSFREDGVSLEDAERTIHEDPLSVQVRSGWYLPGAALEYAGPAEYEILLCTGGPACRIVGDLDEYGQPSSARLEVQDWFQPWTSMRPHVSKGDYDSEPILLAYARCFYFGEG